MGPVKADGFSFRAVVHNHVKSAHDGDDELAQLLVRMATALSAARNIIEVVNSFDVEININACVYRRDVSLAVMNGGKLDNPAIVYG